MNSKRWHYIVAGVWTALFVPSLLWWKESILWVIAISLFANVYTAIAAAEASNKATNCCVHCPEDPPKRPGHSNGVSAWDDPRGPELPWIY